MKKYILIIIYIFINHSIFSYTLNSDLSPDKNKIIKILSDEIVDSYYEIFGVKINRVKSININSDKNYNGIYVIYNSMLNNSDYIYLYIKNEKQLMSPKDGGNYNVFGFCHEFGHSLIKFNNFILDEGIASFTGTIIVEDIYYKLGQNAWIYPYNYLSTEGPIRFKEWGNSKSIPYLNFSNSLYVLYKKYGKLLFKDIFKELDLENNNYNKNFISKEKFFELLGNKISILDYMQFIINIT